MGGLGVARGLCTPLDRCWEAGGAMEAVWGGGVMVGRGCRGRAPRASAVLTSSAHSLLLSESRLRSLSHSALLSEVASAEMSLHAIYLHEVRPPAPLPVAPLGQGSLAVPSCAHPGALPVSPAHHLPRVLPGPGTGPQSLVPSLPSPVPCWAGPCAPCSAV